MKSTRHLLSLLAMAAMAAALLTACGSDSDGNDGGGQGQKPSVNANANVATDDKAVLRLEFPKLDDSGNSMVVVHRTSASTFDKDRVNYSIEWDKQKKSQRWSCYQMHKGYNGSYSRVIRNYPDDPNIPVASRWANDYIYGSGFQHGHICPSADRTFSYEANMQTFYMSNMQPQYPKFNGYEGSDLGLWLKMENKVTALAKQLKSTDTIWVCKGGTIDKEEHIIKRINDRLIVPKYFFMAILKKSSLGYAAFGFWAEQKDQWGTNEKLSKYAMSIDKLEKLTGIDFFCNLPDNEEKAVEAVFYPAYWGLN